uniref:AD domain-containing protein n=1 Tax=Strongyloides papillosus TaxID=174720 RepID=A0A0N5BJH6_STREA
MSSEVFSMSCFPNDDDYQGSLSALFAQGSLISMTSRTGEVLEGILLAYHLDYQIMAIYIPETNEKNPQLKIVNMHHFNDVKILKAPQSGFKLPFPTTSTSEERNSRMAAAIKKREQQFMKEEISREGQEAFLVLQQTIDKIRWDKKDIVVLDCVRIVEPYTPECVQLLSGDEESSVSNKRSLEYVTNCLKTKNSILERILSSSNKSV